MFGEDGWCSSCGIPQRRQSGSLRLSKKGPFAVGAWIPNWRYDAICVDRSVAAEIRLRFDVHLVPVRAPAGKEMTAAQIVVPTVGTSWFSPDDLRTAATVRHGADGTTCLECGVWRWLPLPLAELPDPRLRAPLDKVDIAGSPEWFGDGMKAFRQIVVRRELAELLVNASPRDLRLRELA